MTVRGGSLISHVYSVETNRKNCLLIINQMIVLFRRVLTFPPNLMIDWVHHRVNNIDGPQNSNENKMKILNP